MAPAANAADWAMPWIPPTDPLTREVLSKLGSPLTAAATGEGFDVPEFYNQFTQREISALERQVEAVGARPEWRLEDVALIDAEDSDERKQAYEDACVTIDGYRIVPRSLAAYTMLAYQAADFDGEADSPDAKAVGDLDYALAWTRAGLSVLQQSLPYPFTGVLRYAHVDHRSAHRLLLAHALVLRQRHPREAVAWLRAMVYLDPNDNLGARYLMTGGVR
jgi:hypothetical protein